MGHSKLYFYSDGCCNVDNSNWLSCSKINPMFGITEIRKAEKFKSMKGWMMGISFNKTEAFLIINILRPYLGRGYNVNMTFL